MILRGGVIVSMVPGERPFVGDLRLSGGRIVEIAPAIVHAGSAEEIVDARGCVLMPGFVQAHVHLCQTLFRGLADDLELLDWLEQRVWPMEAWHEAGSMAASARLGLYELISGGTTALLDMGSVNHSDELFAAAEEAGVRYVGGKCLMDLGGANVPDALVEEARDALEDSERLIKRWHGAAEGRLGYAISPRFAVSCSDEALRGCADLARKQGVAIHTHASENRGEIALVKSRTGKDNIRYLDDCGLLGERSVLAHCVHLQEGEPELLRDRGVHVAHCPGSNLKLASGIAPIPELLELGVNVALGADGSPCNNRLDMFREMHLAATIHKPKQGPRAMPARRVLEMATMGGARALGLEDEIGSLEVGKKGDLILIELEALETFSIGAIEAEIVYALGRNAVRDVIVEGEFLKRDFELVTLDENEVFAAAHSAFERLRADFPDQVEGGP